MDSLDVVEVLSSLREAENLTCRAMSYAPTAQRRTDTRSREFMLEVACNVVDKVVMMVLLSPDGRGLRTPTVTSCRKLIYRHGYVGGSYRL